MPEIQDCNSHVIEELRANGGKVGGNSEGAPIPLLHHTGAKSGQERVTPIMDQRAGDSLAVFASKGGAPTNPAWYHNLVAHPRVVVEVGADTVPGWRAWRATRIASPSGRSRSTTTRDSPTTRSRIDRRIPVVLLERAS